jgi:hypothetical protein
LYNGKTYTMKDIMVSEDGNECTITGSISDFFSMLATHMSMEFELLSAFSHSGAVHNLADRLPRRQKFRNGDLQANRRHAALSITSLLVYNTESSGLKVMLRKRSNVVAVYPSLFSIIPGGMFQPEFDIEKEWNIQHCIIREYCEELFSAKNIFNADDPYYIYSDPNWKAAKDLYNALKSGACKILHAGVIVTLQDFIPQLCCVLLIEHPDWWSARKSQLRTNYEFMSRNEFITTVRGARADYDFDDFDAQFLAQVKVINDATGASVSGQWMPSSLGSLWLGIQAVDEYRKNQRPAAKFDPYLATS